jgi:hypothetical protein
MVRVEGGRGEAEKYGPCVFLEFKQEGPSFRARVYVFGPPGSEPPPDGQ